MSLKDYIAKASTDATYRHDKMPPELATLAKNSTNVLIIEDDAGVGPFLELRLGQWGYNPSLCTNGIDGYAALQREAVDILLTDFNYPPKGGTQVVKDAVRKLQFPPGRIIMFTTDIDEAQGRLEGIPIAILAKPDYKLVKVALDGIVDKALAKIW